MAALDALTSSCHSYDMQEITTREAAQILGITPGALAQQTRRGIIPHTRKLPGATGTYLFDRAVIEQHASK